MKAMLTVLLIVVLMLVLLPMGMGTADCPMCTSPDTHLALGICAAVVALIGSAVSLMATRFRSFEFMLRASLISEIIYRPPRIA